MYKIKSSFYVKVLQLFLVFIVSTTLINCGGGGSSSSSPSTATGYFIDSPVQGLTYVSGGQSGTTDANGKFTYEVGKTVKFSVGAISLGEVSAKGKMTPVDMVANADASNTTVLKITRFLMTLDSDNDATNGITISDVTKTAAQSVSQIDFATATDADLTSALTPLTTNTTVSSSTAQTHLTSSIYGLYAGSYSGTHSGNCSTCSGTLTAIIDSNGVLTGTESSPTGGSDPFSSQLTTSGTATFSLSGVTSQGVSFSGTIDASTGVMSGTWSDRSGYSGTWTVTKQATTTTTSTTTTTTSTTTTEAPITQVTNSSGGRINHVNVGNVTFSDNLSYNVGLYTFDNGSYCGDGCSTAFSDVSEGTNNVVVYQTATSTPVSVGSLGSFVAGKAYSVTIRTVSGSYCAELWHKLDTNLIFNNDTTRVLIATTCP